MKNAARIVFVCLLFVFACSPKASQPPALFLDVKLVRPPGYRCGTPDNTSRPLYACAIDTAFINTNGKSLWIFHRGELLRSCRECQTIGLELEGLYGTVYVVAIDAYVAPVASFDRSMVLLEKNQADKKYVAIKVSP